MGFKVIVPWPAKIVIKLVLSRVPKGYSFWKRLGMFQHGQMDKPEYAYEIFMKHFSRTDISRYHKGFVGLELGPGDSLFSALIAYAYGATATYLVDAGYYAQNKMGPYHKAAIYFSRKGLPVPEVEHLSSLDHLLLACNAKYLTSGLSSLRSLPDRSVDIIWSQAVLEHVKRNEFADLIKELRRIIRPNGVCSHRIDLKDHLGGSLNSLRFSEGLWESDFFFNSGFYTNRIRFSEMKDIFTRAGFNVEVVDVARWSRLPIPLKKLSEEFKHCLEDDLCVYGFDVILRPV